MLLAAADALALLLVVLEAEVPVDALPPELALLEVLTV